MPTPLPAPKRRFRALAVVATLAAAVFATSACAAEAPEEASSPSNASIALVAQSAPSSLDPAQLADGQQQYVWGSIFDTLLIIDNAGEIQPNAAESWEVSEDALSITLKLRDGMTFSSGDPVDAAAVKSSIERTMETPGNQQGKFSAVESVDAPDDSTVVLNLSEPDASLPVSLATGSGVIGDPATVDEDRTATNPVGSGPYVLNTEKTVPGTSYVLDRRDDHWNVDAFPFKTVTVRVIQDRTAAFNALQAGEVNVANVDVNQQKSLDAAKFTITNIPAQAIANLVLADRDGTVVPALADEKVRQAINMAMDRTKFVETFLQGNGIPSVQIFNPKGVAYDESLEKLYSYDVEAAKGLLAEAGYSDGFTVTMPSTAISTNFEPTLTQALADIGISVKWEPVPPGDTVAAITSKKYGMFFFIDGVNATPKELANNFVPEAFLNPFNSEDPELTELLDALDAEVDPDAQADLYKEINAYVVEHAWDAPVAFIGTNIATTTGIEYLGDGSNGQQTIRAFGITE